ncbi:extracellular superoxide dismutase [Cu-Zn]-like [Engraulis encrasicolus]|uniref:extracellular superoxide dismutase [Cu-Zn]-like n=1 Tax=Engraulis encrasicolus TaxID=184585 RepID=UPI002FD2D6FA
MKSPYRCFFLMALCGCQMYLSNGHNYITPPELTENSGVLYATCKMRPNAKLPADMPKIYGHVLFRHEYAQAKLNVAINLQGFPAPDEQTRAIHIHQFGDLSEGCASTGGHYNPLGVNHPQHPGDFGNFQPSEDGKIVKMLDSDATLFGGLSILGRAVVIHAKSDDMGLGGDAGSLLHGNAGARLACCVIGMSKSKLWDNNSNEEGVNKITLSTDPLDFVTELKE